MEINKTVRLAFADTITCGEEDVPLEFGLLPAASDHEAQVSSQIECPHVKTRVLEQGCLSFLGDPPTLLTMNSDNEI